MGSSRLFLDQNHFFNFLIHFAPRGATRNLTFLNTQNWPTLLVSCPNIQCLPCIPLPYIRWLPWSAAQTLGVYLYSAAPIFSVHLDHLPQDSVFALVSCLNIWCLPWSAASTFGVYLGQLPQHSVFTLVSCLNIWCFPWSASPSFGDPLGQLPQHSVFTLVSCPNIRYLPWSAAPTFGVYLSQLPQHSVFTLLSCHIILWLPWSAASTFGVYLGQLPLSKHFAGHQSKDCHANVQVVLLNWQCHKILWRNLAMSVCI